MKVNYECQVRRLTKNASFPTGRFAIGPNFQKDNHECDIPGFNEVILREKKGNKTMASLYRPSEL